MEKKPMTPPADRLFDPQTDQRAISVIAHLVTAHQYHRIAFIRGQVGYQEADDRYQAYLDVLSRHNLPFDSEIVYQGDFKESGGIEGA
jgi:DNA-binding LacI/PurR family transcriptional regulator